MSTDKLDRKKRYYQKHRNKILNSLREKRQPSRQEPLAVSLGRTLRQFASLFHQCAEKLLLAFLVISCTGFLVTESARSIAGFEGNGSLAKALLCEVVLIGISMLATSTRRMQILRSVVLVGICALSLLNTIGGPLTSFAQAKQSVQSKTEQVSILNRVIEQKQTLLARYLVSDRISGARRIESEIARLSIRLSQVKRELAEQKSEFILALGFAIAVLFRVVIMAANIVFASRLGELLRERPIQKCHGVSTSPKLFLVKT